MIDVLNVWGRTKMVKFSELNQEAKAVAIQDYIKGWKQTHSNEIMSVNEANILCIDTDEEFEYSKEGIMKEES